MHNRKAAKKQFTKNKNANKRNQRSELRGFCKYISGTLGTFGLFCNSFLITSLALVPSRASPPPPVSLRIPDLSPTRRPCARLAKLSTDILKGSRRSLIDGLPPTERSSSEKCSSTRVSLSIDMAVSGGVVWFTAGDVIDLVCRGGRTVCWMLV